MPADPGALATEKRICPLGYRRVIVAPGLRFAETKWNLRIVAALLWKPMGFNQLSRFLGDISTGTLSSRLGDLEARGLITRTVLSVTPPSTLYDVDRAGGNCAWSSARWPVGASGG